MGRRSPNHPVVPTQTHGENERRPSQVASAINLCIEASQPVMLHGSPGVGKSDVVRQVAAQRGIDMIDLRLSQLDPVDLN